MLEADQEALVRFFNLLEGTDWTDNTNWTNPDADVHDWHGITVNDSQVTSINLSNNNLVGEMPIPVQKILTVLYAPTSLDTAERNLNHRVIKALTIFRTGTAWHDPTVVATAHHTDWPP